MRKRILRRASIAQIYPATRRKSVLRIMHQKAYQAAVLVQCRFRSEEFLFEAAAVNFHQAFEIFAGQQPA